MVHVYFLSYTVLLLITSVLLSVILQRRLKKREKLDKYLLFFIGCLFSDIAIGYSYYYFLPNIISINPLSQNIGLDIVAKSIPYFALLTLQAALIPISHYQLFCIMHEVIKSSLGKKPFLAASIGLSSWLFVSNWSVPIFFKSRSNIIGIICYLNEHIMLWLQAIIVIAIAFYWRSRKNKVEGSAEKLCRSLLVTMIIVVILLFLRLLSERIFNIREASVFFEITLLVTNRSIMICLLSVTSVINYLLRIHRLDIKNSGSGEISIPWVNEEFAKLYRLTAREAEIASLIAKGIANKEISLQLGISYNTVKNHNVRLFSKIGIFSRFELIAKLHEFSGKSQLNEPAKQN